MKQLSNIIILGNLLLLTGVAIANTLTDDLTSAGDLNGDGVVNIADIVCLVNHISINNSSYNSVVFTDLNGDGTTNGEDITYLVNTVMGKKEAGKPVVDTLRVFFEENSANVDGCFNKNIIKTSIRGTKVIIVAYGKRPFVCKAEGLCQDGNLTIYSDTTCTLILNNLCLSSTESAAIVLANKQNVIIKLPKESQNELCDAPFREKDSESFNACLYSKGTITFSGEGNLSVSGKYYHAIASSKNISIEGCNINIAEIQKNGIHCDKFTLKEGKIGINLQNASSKGIKAKEKFTMKGGCIEGKAVGGICIENGDVSYSALLKCNGDMIISDGNIVLKHSGGGGRCISVDGNLTISGGSFTLECNGDGGKYINESSEEDYYTPKCITVDDSVFIKNGTISCHSTGLGGKGIVAGKYLSIGSEQEDNIVYAPTIRVETQGECIINNVDEDLRFGCPKGIKSDSTLFIYSGDIAVKTAGMGGEGVECNGVMFIKGGTLECNTFDDGINVGQSIEISSGNVYCNSVDNDGIDSNGSIIISGGIVASINQTKPNESLDAENGKLFFRGGIVFGIGSAAVTGISSSCPYYNTRYDLHSENMPKRGLLLNYGKYVCVQKGNEILMALRNYNKEHRQFVTIIHPLFELSGFYVISEGDMPLNPEYTMFDGNFVLGGLVNKASIVENM